MHDVEQKLRILFGDGGVVPSGVSAGRQLRRKHRGFAEDRDAPFADRHHHALMPAFDRNARRIIVELTEGLECKKSLQSEKSVPVAAVDLKRGAGERRHRINPLLLRTASRDRVVGQRFVGARVKERSGGAAGPRRSRCGIARRKPRQFSAVAGIGK